MSIAKQFEETLSRSGRGLSHQMDRTGLVLAVVTNIKDEEKLNRVKCQILDNEKNDQSCSPHPRTCVCRLERCTTCKLTFIWEK